MCYTTEGERKLSGLLKFLFYPSDTEPEVSTRVRMNLGKMLNSSSQKHNREISLTLKKKGATSETHTGSYRQNVFYEVLSQRSNVKEIKFY